MKIAEIAVRNCLSFGQHGCNEDNCINFKNFNLFIGSNNAGKSNVLKLMQLLKLVLSSAQPGRSELLLNYTLGSVKGLNYLRDWFFNQDLSSKIEFSFTLTIDETDKFIVEAITNYSHEKPNPILFMFQQIQKGYPKTIKIHGFIEHRGLRQEDYFFISLVKTEIPNEHRYYKEVPLFDVEKKKVLSLQKEGGIDELVWKSAQRHDDEDFKKIFKSSVDEHLKRFLSEINNEVFANLIVNIHAVRESNEMIINILEKLRDGRQREWELFNRIQGFLQNLIFDDENREIRLIFPLNENGDKRGIGIATGDLILPLSHYGSGVEQILAMITEIAQYGQGKIILIEEPEAHLHPHLQKKFMNFLRNNNDYFKHQYLIATHSPLLIDQANLDEVWVVSKNESGSRAVHCTSKNELSKALWELGIKPSDFLFANGLLIVEGKTDEKVLRDWARKIDNPFEGVNIVVIDVEGYGNIQKYIKSEVIQRTTFKLYALIDKNAENAVKEAVKGACPEENIFVLSKGDLEDYYPRDIVLEFAKEFAPKKGKKPAEMPNEILEGKTVETLNGLLNGDWWKAILANRITSEMTSNQIDDEVKNKIISVYQSIGK